MNREYIETISREAAVEATSYLTGIGLRRTGELEDLVQRTIAGYLLKSRKIVKGE